MTRKNPEAALQRALVKHIKARGIPGLICAHVANAPRSAIAGHRQKEMGALAGMPDLLFWHDGKPYALELKTENGRLSAKQTEVLGNFTSQRVLCYCAHGLDDALTKLLEWGLIR